MLCAVAGQADEGQRQLPQRPEQADDLLALAAVRQDQGDVVGVDHAQVAVDRLGGVEDVGAGAGRVERAGDLLADVGRLAGAGDGDAAGAAVEEIDGLEEGIVQARTCSRAAASPRMICRAKPRPVGVRSERAWIGNRRRHGCILANPATLARHSRRRGVFRR